MCARAVLLALACALVLPAHAAIDRELAVHTQSPPPVLPSRPVNHPKGGVCESIDIRNYPKNLEKLRGCRVIEGVLQIVLMESLNRTEFGKYSFPELQEITGHLLMFRVNNLINLGKLFPNLSVIRGRTLFRDYALIIYQLRDIQTVGLYSLTNITRGSVRIEKNTKLCYANSINWDIIAPARGHVIEQNRAENECGLCPSVVTGPAPQNTKECPVDIRNDNKKKHLCWDPTHCQKICKAECGERACSDSGECCDSNCIGGCSGPKANQCHVCRDLSITQQGNEIRCVPNCPGGMFQHNGRCISDTECREQRRPKENKNPNLKENTRFKPINGTCMLECPPGYDEEIVDGNATCKRCNGTCTRSCQPGKIDAIENIERFRGCTLIMGTLEISIKGGARVVKELESALGQITEIRGSLKVIRSYPLMSLQFLKSLRVIGGVEEGIPDERVQSLYIFENPNLEELWDWESHGDINITKGKLFIHFNPKLCMQKIQRLQNMTAHKTFTHLEVAPDSNGDKAACDIEPLSLVVSQRNTTTVVLKWNAFCLEDDRSLLGYLVYYIQTSKPISRFEGRDACGDGWEVVDYPSGQETVNASSLTSSFNCNKNISRFHILTKLKPFTDYGIYVRTSTLLREKKGAQSPIIYVTTMPAQPSPPTITKLESVKPNEIFVQWQPPQYPQGEIISYHVLVTWEEDRLEGMPPRNYCTQPPGADYDKPTPTVLSEVARQKKEREKAKQEVAACKCDSKPLVDNQDELQDSIDFENQLQNKVYIKVGDRSRRSIDSKMEDKVMPSNVQNKTTRGMYTVYWQDVWGQSQMELRVTHLLHYARYKVSVYACRRVDPDEINHTVVHNCSEPALNEVRTKKLDGADEVQSVRASVLVSNTSSSVVRVSWMPPEHPNGVIVSYHVQYLGVDTENSSPILQCMTRQRAQQSGNVLEFPAPPPGNYSVQVWATSYMGASLPSAPAYFYIEVSRGGSVLELVLGALAAVLLLAAVAACVLYRMRAHSFAGASKLFASVNPEYATAVYEPDDWEVPRDSIQFVRELGQGSFGMVYEGIAKDIVKGKPEMRCAVKTVNEHATERERIEFLNEASVMKAFETPHVVRLLGVVSCGQPTLVVMELMECGDLKTYLRSHRPDTDAHSRTVKANPPTLQRIKQMAIEIADGMAYLSAKKYVHRDLAARNCMVARDLTVKVGDFGMTRDIYETDYYRKGTKGLLPVRWMSPESLKDGVFTSTSDVWSFGVVLWEMATLAMQPYQGLSNEQVFRYVVEGGVMERPDNCPDSLYELMRSCWTHRASARPSFLQLVATLLPDAAPHFQTLSFFHTPQGQEIYAQQLINGQEEEARTSEVGGEGVAGSAGVAGSTSYGVSGRLASWARELASVRSSAARSDPDHAELLSALVSKPALPPNGVLARRRDHDATSQC